MAVDGVRGAAVNLATERATVNMDGDDVPDDALTQAVAAAGFEATIASDDEGDHAGRHHHDHGETGNATRDWLIWSCFAVLAVVVMILAMAWHDPPRWNIWAQFALTLPIQIILGWSFYKGTWRGLKHASVDMDALVAMGSTVAFGYSTYAAIAGVKPVYFETAAMILVLIALGKLMEARAKSNAKAAMRSLAKLQPRQATVIRDGREQTIGIDQIHPGDTILVKPGQSVPVDGQVIEGKSSIDQSMVTGESMPVDIGEGDDLIGGTVNQTGAFKFEATRTGKDTTLAQIMKLVEDAQASKAAVQRIADKVAGVFVPTVLVIAAVTFVGWGIFGHADGVDQALIGSTRSTGGWRLGMYAAIAVLIVACPCAMGLATPTAIMVGTGLGASHGILIKDAAALERAGKLTHIILDKTGTLTQGKFAVSDVVLIKDGLDSNRLLSLAASVESQSEHPLGAAIVRYAKEHDLPLFEVTDFDSETGRGVQAAVEGQTVEVAKPQAFTQRGAPGSDEMDEHLQGMDPAAGTIVAVAIDGQVVGMIALADQIKPDAQAAIDQLHDLGLNVLLMTGDREQVAQAVARQLGIDQVFTEVRPNDKSGKVEELQKQGHIVAMVGDGINDGPALAAADIGIAMGGGTDVAANAGHVVLVGGDLQGLPDAITLSGATMRRIYLGLFWAFAYNVLLIPLAAFGWMHPMFAAGAMSISSVSVVINALWLRRAWQPHESPADEQQGIV